MGNTMARRTSDEETNNGPHHKYFIENYSFEKYEFK